ncbi:MAG TPA: hypothetical protein VD999_02865 [Vitreimonas sp.]|nr:hypothetical protein [Vitreimonas sp.]
MFYYIKENYYFDIDLYHQFRITGPANHLLLGLSLPKGVPLEVKEYYIENEQLVVKLELLADQLQLPLPLVTDIRTLRALTEPKTPRPTYQELLLQSPELVKPRTITQRQDDEFQVITFTNQYQELDKPLTYGSELWLPKEYWVELSETQLQIKAESPLVLCIKTQNNVTSKAPATKQLFKEATQLPENMFSQKLIKLYTDAYQHIEHLIKAQKTSSFEYGTVFPRDWIESADLGSTELTQDTIDYMYSQAMEFVSDDGEGWHENIVGEFKHKNADESTHIDRKMIDIEPRYIMGVRRVSKKFLTDPEHHRRLKLIAKFILKNAAECHQISFKKRRDSEEYEVVGNWRDSYYGYPRHKAPLSPYDVNCVFYPISLKIIQEFADYFEIEDKEHLATLIKKWDEQKVRFRLYHDDNLIGYSLALHGKKRLPLPIAHLDESYDLFYGSPSMEEIVSFAQKITSPHFFYSPSGPLLVDIDDDFFTTEHYHGKVIWPKQAAFSIAGLARQLQRGHQELWPRAVLETIQESIITTAQACFRAWEQLEAIPELYYHDFMENRARLYTDQAQIEGQMSLIQLWSAVGGRRIMQEYVKVIE